MEESCHYASCSWVILQEWNLWKVFLLFPYIYTRSSKHWRATILLSHGETSRLPSDLCKKKHLRGFQPVDCSTGILAPSPHGTVVSTQLKNDSNIHSFWVTHLVRRWLVSWGQWFNSLMDLNLKQAFSSCIHCEHNWQAEKNSAAWVLWFSSTLLELTSHYFNTKDQGIQGIHQLVFF